MRAVHIDDQVALHGARARLSSGGRPLHRPPEESARRSPRKAGDGIGVADVEGVVTRSGGARCAVSGARACRRPGARKLRHHLDCAVEDGKDEGPYGASRDWSRRAPGASLAWGEGLDAGTLPAACRIGRLRRVAGLGSRQWLPVRRYQFRDPAGGVGCQARQHVPEVLERVDPMSLTVRSQ